MCDRPVELPFFPHSEISAPQESFDPSRAIPVLVTGRHQFSGQRGVTCGFIDYDNHGVGNFQVELEPEKNRVVIPAANLLPWYVIFSQFDHDMIELYGSPPIGSYLTIMTGEHEGKAGELISINGIIVTIRHFDDESNQLDVSFSDWFALI